MTELLRLTFPVLARPIDLVGCDNTADDLASILRGWNPAVGPIETEPAPHVRIEKTETGFNWISQTGSLPRRWSERPSRTAMDIVVDIHVHLSGWHLQTAASHCLVHCAAVRIGAGLVVFPSTYKAGKSVLSVQFAKAGFRVYGDDLLMLAGDNCTGIALGMLPRLRLPLPETIDAPTGGFIDARRGFADETRMYVALKETELASLGESAPVSGFVLLDRQADGPAVLNPVSQGEMMKFAIGRNFTDGLTQIEIFDRFEAITRDRRRLRLRYSRGEDAIALLARVFGG